MMTFDSINNNDNAMLANYIYFDGELENKFNYDIVAVLSTVDCEIRHDRKGRGYKVPLFPIGTFSVKVVGIDEPCTLYTWMQVDEVHGHIVLDSDKVAVEYAKAQQLEYAEFNEDAE